MQKYSKNCMSFVKKCEIEKIQMINFKSQKHKSPKQIKGAVWNSTFEHWILFELCLLFGASGLSI